MFRYKLKYRDGLFAVDFDYFPPDSFSFTDTVLVGLEATDLSKNHNRGEKWYQFYIEKNQVPPVLQAVRPVPNQVEVPLNTDIVLYAKDDINRLMIESFELQVNGIPVSSDNINFQYDGQGFTITHQPNAFDFNEQVDISCEIADSDSNWTTLNYRFWVITDTTAPNIEIVRPKPDQK